MLHLLTQVFFWTINIPPTKSRNIIHFIKSFNKKKTQNIFIAFYLFNSTVKMAVKKIVYQLTSLSKFHLFINLSIIGTLHRQCFKICFPAVTLLIISIKKALCLSIWEGKCVFHKSKKLSDNQFVNLENYEKKINSCSVYTIP